MITRFHTKKFGRAGQRRNFTAKTPDQAWCEWSMRALDVRRSRFRSRWACAIVLYDCPKRVPSGRRSEAHTVIKDQRTRKIPLVVAGHVRCSQAGMLGDSVVKGLVLDVKKSRAKRGKSTAATTEVPAAQYL